MSDATAPATVADTHPALHAAVSVRLDDWGVIEAVGEDAASFLDGQLTQRLPQGVGGLLSPQAVLAGYCSPKGRLLATFVIWQHAPQTWRLACSRDLLAATHKRLSMFVMRAKCKLSDLGDAVSVQGLMLQDAPGIGAATLPAPWALQRPDETTARIRLGDVQGCARWLQIGPSTGETAGAAALDAAALPDWQHLEVASGVARIVAATADQFVPQMVNLDAAGGLNFHKGCYPGQEIVARSQYRGTIKRRAFVLEAADARPATAQSDDAQAIAPGADVRTDGAEGAEPVGMVVLVAGGAMLAELRLQAVDSGAPLRCGGRTWRPVQPQPLELSALD